MERLLNLISKSINFIYKNIVVIAPHPDDEIIGAFSIMETGKVNILIVVTDGGNQTIKKTHNTIDYIKARLSESKDYATRCKLNSICNMHYPDGYLYEIIKDNKKNHNKLLSQFSKIIPNNSLVFCTSPYDKHKDHTIIANTIKNIKFFTEKNIEIIYYLTGEHSVNKHDLKKNYYKIKFSKELYDKKMKLFSEFYPTQLWRLQESNYNFNMDEYYYIENLCVKN